MLKGNRLESDEVAKVVAEAFTTLTGYPLDWGSIHVNVLLTKLCCIEDSDFVFTVMGSNFSAVMDGSGDWFVNRITESDFKFLMMLESSGKIVTHI